MRSLALCLLLALPATGCMPPRFARSAGAFADPRARALAGVRPGMGVRLLSTEKGLIEGRIEGLSEDGVIILDSTGYREISISAIERIHINRDYSVAGVAAGMAAGAAVPAAIELITTGVTSVSLGAGLLAGVYGAFTMIGGGLGMAIAGMTSGWEQVFPDRIHPGNWMHPARMSAGVLSAAVRLEVTEARAGDSLLAHVDLINGGRDSLEILERACGPMLVIVGPGGREWAAPACAPGLAVLRLPPGRLTRDVWLPATMPSGPYQVEYRVVRPAATRLYPLDAGGATRIAARAGMVVGGRW